MNPAPTAPPPARCLGELRATAHVFRPVKAELRANRHHLAKCWNTHEQMLEALRYVLKHAGANGSNCGDHCLNSCEWCVVREAIKAAEEQ